jgi:hypothetical protein
VRENRRETAKVRFGVMDRAAFGSVRVCCFGQFASAAVGHGCGSMDLLWTHFCNFHFYFAGAVIMEGLFGAAFAAAAAGDLDGVQSLLSSGISPTCCDHEGNTFLHAAVRSGNACLVQVRGAGPRVCFFFFISHGATPSCTVVQVGFGLLALSAIFMIDLIYEMHPPAEGIFVPVLGCCVLVHFTVFCMGFLT